MSHLCSSVASVANVFVFSSVSSVTSVVGSPRPCPYSDRSDNRDSHGSFAVIKVALIGAGSVVFSKNLTGDILSFPEFKNATISYMDVDPDRLEVAANLGRKVAKAVGASPKIAATLDRREALDGADFVINMVQIG